MYPPHDSTFTFPGQDLPSMIMARLCAVCLQEDGKTRSDSSRSFLAIVFVLSASYTESRVVMPGQSSLKSRVFTAYIMFVGRGVLPAMWQELVGRVGSANHVYLKTLYSHFHNISVFVR